MLWRDDRVAQKREEKREERARRRGGNRDRLPSPVDISALLNVEISQPSPRISQFLSDEISFRGDSPPFPFNRAAISPAVYY